MVEISTIVPNGIEILQQSALTAEADLENWLAGVRDPNNLWRGKTKILRGVEAWLCSNCPSSPSQERYDDVLSQPGLLRTGGICAGTCALSADE